MPRSDGNMRHALDVHSGRLVCVCVGALSCVTRRVKVQVSTRHQPVAPAHEPAPKHRFYNVVCITRSPSPNRSDTAKYTFSPLTPSSK